MSSTISKDGLQLFQLYLGLTPSVTNTKDIDYVIFIAIDFKNKDNFKYGSSQKLNSQVGVAILDTQNLVSSPRTTISTSNFVTGFPSYCDRCTKRFHFGGTVTICQKDMCQNFETLISPKRNNVLVGHDFPNDLKILEFLKFDLCSSIIGIWDTQRIAAERRPHAPAKLRDILKQLRCPFDRLHNASDDVHFTLRALFLFATKIYPHGVVANSDIQN